MYYHICFPGNFLQFFTIVLWNTPGWLFSWFIKSLGWITVIYFFIAHFSVFWVFFTSVRNTFKLLAINVGFSPSKKHCFISFKESPLKMMKKAYFILKAIFVLRMFVLTFWSSRKNSLIRKIRLISKFMTSQPS